MSATVCHECDGTGYIIRDMQVEDRMVQVGEPCQTCHPIDDTAEREEVGLKD